MYIRKAKLKDGDIYLSIHQGYRDKNGKAANKTIKTLGRLSHLCDSWDMSKEDALEKCKKMCDEITEEYKNKIPKPEIIKISLDELVDMKHTNRKNLGSCILLAFYNALGIEKVIRNITCDTKLFSNKHYDINAVLRLLVIEKLLNRSSALQAWNNKDKYFFKTDFTLDDMYRAYDCFSYNKDRIIKAINKGLENLNIRDGFDTVFYDVTNYYMETDEQTDSIIDRKDLELNEDGNVINTYSDAYYDLSDEKVVERALIKYGHEKMGRHKPIISMGLLQDKYAIPITYRLFPGNTTDYETMLPILEQLKKDYHLGRIIVVADKGNNTSTNIAACVGKKNGFVFSQSIRGTKSPKSLRDWVIDSSGYKYTSKDFKIKSKIDKKVIHLSEKDTASGKPEKKEIDIKIIAFWSRKYEVRARHVRQKTINKAYEYIENNGKYESAINYGAAKYVEGIQYDKHTAEVIDTDQTLKFNQDKLDEDEACDGYYCIITSEIDMSDEDIIDTYRGLWQIEETFKISKSDLSIRPVRMRTNSHIRGHFLINYIALTLIRVIQHYLHNKYSAKKIIKNIKECCGSLADKNIWLFDYRTNLLDTMYKLIGKKKQVKWMKLSDIKKYFYKGKIPKYRKKSKK